MYILEKIKYAWDNYGFEILLLLSIIIIIIIGIYNKIYGKQGTYIKNKEELRIRNIPKINPILNNNNTNNKSKGETECRNVLQNLFRKPFPSSRPDFLRNPVTGGNFNLELDCYNTELNLAVEYNGIQHYKYTPYFHRNKEHFMTQKYRDDMKRRICKEYGINLIEVPYTVKIQNIKSYIVNECLKLGYLL